MNKRTFDRVLLGRLLAAIRMAGLATTVAALPACGNEAPDAASGAGGQSGHGGGGGAAGSAAEGPAAQGSAVASTGTSSGPVFGTETLCLDWSADAGPCPGPAQAKTQLEAKYIGMYTSIKSVDSDGTFESGECCYEATVQYVSGRPYLVEDRPRLAPKRSQARSAWAGTGAPPDVAGLGSSERARLGDEWAADALAEHASVASFARFALELMAFGAPAELVAAAHAAALDEVRHARLCFALADAYRGESIAPGPFPLGDSVPIARDLETFLVSVVKEGCIGETLSALQAAEQLGHAEDPEVRAALAVIARDEARHAELAWRTVAWALGQAPPGTRAALARVFAQALASASPAPRDAAPGDLARHGRLDAGRIAAVRRYALDEVVHPAAEALLGACREAHPG